MHLQDEINIHDVFIQPLNDNRFRNVNIHVDVLRLDKIHPIVSGNKWFKLKYWLQNAAEKNYTTIATFGGAFSNHILATAYACNKQNFKCIGFIRGEEPKQYSQTLLDAKALNMQLEFISREKYQNKQNIIQKNKSLYFISEGGYGTTGAKGAAEILQIVPNLLNYNYIICAVGTGTMLAGIANASLPHQQCVGVSVMKNNFSLNDEVFALVNDESKNRAEILHDYHFGGYAKYTQPLINFINEIWNRFQLPLDFVYTAKALCAVYQLAAKSYFQPNSRILFIHSGGLQGNRSLSKEVLIYD
jgi:1-aminocyclopropane-1-carboxylate deaminase/D-cysteine desulfhydrase-like pyridoxal-dependent ACC family enzyme